MPVEILRDTFTRADSAAVGTPEYALGGVSYTEGEVSGGTIGITSGKLQAALSTIQSWGMVSIDAGAGDHGIFARLDSCVGSTSEPFLAIRSPTSPVSNFYNNGAFAAVKNGWSLSHDYNSGLVRLLYYDGGGTNVYNSGSITGFNGRSAGEWGLVGEKDWILVFYEGRLIYSAQSILGINNTFVACGVTMPQTGSATTAIWSRLRVDRRRSSYPVPGMPKMAYDRDGSTAYAYRSSAAASYTALTSGQAASLNDVSVSNPATTSPGDTGVGTEQGIAVMFPETRDLYGHFSRYNFASGSTNNYYTTSPVGTAPGSATWTQLVYGVAQPTESASPTIPNFRTGLSLVSLLGITGIRIAPSVGANQPGGIFYTLHLYGFPQSGAGVHRVRFWHPYLDMPLPGDYLDMDDIIRNGTYYREFRIKNFSSVYTLNNVVLDLESPDYGTALTDEFSIKRASQGTYQPNTTVATLAPGALSEIVSIRRIVGAAAPFRLDSLRVRSQIGSLS